MKLLSGQVDDGTLVFSDFNIFSEEMENLILQFGRTLDGTGVDVSQAIKSLALMAGGANWFTHSGTNTVTLAAVAGVQAPDGLQNGYVARFRPTAANTGATTVALAGLTAKPLSLEDGSALVGGELQTTVDAVIRYDSGADDWFLLTPVLSGSEVLLQTYTPSGASTQNVALDTSFAEFRVEFRGMTVGSLNADIEFVVSDDAGSTFETGASDYGRAWTQNSVGGTQNASNSAAFGWLIRTHSNTADDWYDCDMHITQPGDGTFAFGCKIIGNGYRAQGVDVNGTVHLDPTVQGVPAARIDLIKVQMSAGTFGGTIRVWGLRR